MSSNTYGYNETSHDWERITSANKKLDIQDTVTHTKLDSIISNTSSSGSSTIIKGLTDITDTNTATFISVDSTGAINTNNVNELLNDGHSQVFLTSAGGTAVKADSSCSITADPEYRDGWNMVNSVAGTKFNFYIFNGAQETLTVADMSSIYFRGFINQYTGISSMPFLQVYTKPTGVNDAGAFYHSRINWVYNNDGRIGIGEECIFYAEGEPTSQFTNRKVELTSKTVQGDGAGTEEILYVVCASNSSAPQNEMNATINLIGFNDMTIKRNYHLVGRHLQVDVNNYPATQAVSGSVSVSNHPTSTEVSNFPTTQAVSGSVSVSNHPTSTEVSNFPSSQPVTGTFYQTTQPVSNSKITQGEGDVAGGGNGLQQILCYGKDQTGNLDPLNVDNNGHLKITIQDIEPNITSSIIVSQPVERASITVDQNDAGGNLNGQIDVGDFTETIDLDGYKVVFIHIDSGETDNLELWTSDHSSSGFVKFDDLYADASGGIKYTNTNLIPRYIRIKNQNGTFYSFNSFKIHLAR